MIDKKLKKVDGKIKALIKRVKAGLADPKVRIILGLVLLLVILASL